MCANKESDTFTTQTIETETSINIPVRIAVPRLIFSSKYISMQQTIHPVKKFISDRRKQVPSDVCYDF